MNDKKTILLTGTGTIGGELLLDSLRGTAHKIFVLMRGDGRRSAEERANDLFGKLALAAEEKARVEVLAGDAAEENFALDGETTGRLASELDFIVHTAAVTSLTADESLCEAVNVGGTKHALRLADLCRSRGKLRRFVYLSTAFVAGAADRSTLVQEDELPDAPRHFNFYEKSKYEAEKLVRAAMKNNLPTAIFRPSMVVGDTQTGWTRYFNVIYPLLRMAVSGYVSRLPADPRAFVHLAPIDSVVRAIAESLDADWTTGKTFNLTVPAAPFVADLFETDSFFEPDAPRPRLIPLARFDWEECPPREKDLLEAMAFCLPYFNSRFRFETSNAARLAALPVADSEYLNRLGQFAAESGYFQRRRRQTQRTREAGV